MIISNTSAVISGLPLTRRGSAPSTPPSDVMVVYQDNDQDLKYIDDAGNIRVLAYSANVFYQTVRDDGSGMTQRAALNFVSGRGLQFVLVDDAGSGETEVKAIVEYSRSFTVEAPSAAENRTIFHVNKAITITEVVAVVVGSPTPSVTIQIEHDTTRNGLGNDLFSSGQAITSVTTGHVLTTFSDATVPAGSFVWLSTSAKSGTVDELHVTIYYTIDT